MSSIAFPTIGCGQLNFNPAVVAECFKAAARDAGATLMVLYNCVTCYFITLLSVFSVSVHCFQKMITVALHVKERNVICDAFLKPVGSTHEFVYEKCYNLFIRKYYSRGCLQCFDTFDWVSGRASLCKRLSDEVLA